MKQNTKTYLIQKKAGKEERKQRTDGTNRKQIVTW